MFRHDRPKRRRLRRWILGGLVVFLLLLVAAGALSVRWYNHNITARNPSDTTTKVFTVYEGDTEVRIASQLEQAGIIRSAFAYQLYTRVNDLHGSAQVGGYKLSPSMSVAEINTVLREGKVAIDLITILPAQRLDQLKKAFLDAGYSESEVDEALDPRQYVGHPALVDKPPLASLEGYLYPESFQRTSNTPLKAIVGQALDQTALMLTDDLKQALQEKQGLNTYQALILASIVEREVSNPDDRSKVAQVFLKRYKEGIPLGSDPTALFGALQAGVDPSLTVDTPYNTLLHPGLPPGPINNVSADSLKAVAYPADTDFLFFVSGDDGKTYFSHTREEHEALTAQHCIQLCKSY